MAKANQKDAYYFSHDSNARNDEKILAMRSVYKSSGYGMYFMLIEILREQTDYKIKIGKYTYGTLAIQLQVDVDELKNFICDCVEEFELLSIEDDFLFSNSLFRRMNLVDEIAEKRRNASKKRWEEKASECKSDANALQVESKEKEKKKEENIKEEKRKEEKKKEHNSIPPEMESVREYCEERKNGINAEEFIDFYSSKGWLVGKAKMKDWKAAIRTWEKNRGFKISEEKKEVVSEEVKSRYSNLTEEEKQQFFDIGAFFLDGEDECVDYGKLEKEQISYLKEKGVI